MATFSSKMHQNGDFFNQYASKLQLFTKNNKIPCFKKMRKNLEKRLDDDENIAIKRYETHAESVS